MLTRAAAVVAASAILTACAANRSTAGLTLDAAAESYVRLALALGERDADSIDSYSGPPSWQAEARQRHATLAEIQREIDALGDRLNAIDVGSDGAVRRDFLGRQLRALSARIDILRGARPTLEQEASELFGLTVAPRSDRAGAARGELDRLLPGRSPLTARLADFQRASVIPPDLVPSVVARAVEECRRVTAANIQLPAGERVDITYVPDLAWPAYTRHPERLRSVVQINASVPMTVDAALDLACHETYPGHHVVYSLVAERFPGRKEFLVQPTFSPQSALQEAAASGASALVFDDAGRIRFERDVLFPLAHLDPAGADRQVQVARLVDSLRPVVASIARRYLDGDLDVARAAIALEQDALMPSAEPTIKFLNRFRSYEATYTVGRDRFWTRLAAIAGGGSREDRWRAYVTLVTRPEQTVE